MADTVRIGVDDACLGLEAPDGRKVFVTVHPSSLLRLPEEVDRRVAFDAFVDDLRAAARLVGSSSAARSAALGG